MQITLLLTFINLYVYVGTKSHRTGMIMLPICGVSTAHRNGTIFGRTDDLTNVIIHAICEICITEVQLLRWVVVTCFSNSAGGPH